MNRRERLLLLVFLAGVLALLGRSAPTAAAIGGVAGAVGGVAIAGRMRRLSRRMDERLGQDAAPQGFSLRRPLVRAAAQLAVLGGLLVTTAVVPFVGEELFVGSAAAVTALPAAVTALRLRR